MTDLPSTDGPRSNPPPTQASAGHCRYCGAPLSSFFYFCLGCGTPYKDINTVVTSAAPRPLSEGELIQTKAPAVWPLFWTYVGVLLVGGIIGALFFEEERPDLALFIQTGLIFITTCVISVMYWRSLVTQFRQVGFLHPAAWLALLLLAPALLVNYGWSTMLQSLLEGIEGDGPEIIDPLLRLREAGVGEWTLVMVFCIYPAITEEIAFRGLVQHWLQVAIQPWRALVLASFLFAALHFSVLSLPYLFGLGMLLGWAKWKTGSLYPSMLIHFLHNLVVIEFF